MLREFHIHIDGIGLSEAAISALQGNGFFLDDFEHYLTIKGEKIHPRHISYIEKDSTLQSSILLKYESAKDILKSNGFFGHIQLEMFSDEIKIAGMKQLSDYYEIPFIITNAPTNKYKTHEFHLKLNKQTPREIINLLKQTQMNYITINEHHFFTVSGKYSIVKSCYRKLVNWLTQNLPLDSIAEINLETTVKNDLFGMVVSELPTVAVQMQ